jgi:putative Mg2+ transporter-C (MgtC) family protein
LPHIFLVDPISTSRIASQLVTGIGFLVAGDLLKVNLLIKENLKAHIYQIKKSVNLTTASCIWFSDDIRMTVGFDLIFILLF